MKDNDSKEKSQIDWEEQFKGNYKLMNDEEKQGTINRLMRSYELRTGKNISMMILIILLTLKKIIEFINYNSNNRNLRNTRRAKLPDMGYWHLEPVS